MPDLLEVPETTIRSADYLADIVMDAHKRTIELAHALEGKRQLGPQLPIVNPPLWEFGHVGFFHDHFALYRLYGEPDYQHPEAKQLYDSARIEHDTRWELPLPSFERTLAYLSTVRNAMLERLPDGGLASQAQSYVYQLTTFHEDMHGEAFTYTRQTLGYPPPRPDNTPDLPATETGPLEGDVYVPGGRHVLGSDENVPFRFDNEKGLKEVHVAPFRIARAPVTNAEFARFVEAGGYQEPRFWDAAGWRWLQLTGLQGPVYWRHGEGGWQLRHFDQWRSLPPHQPVAHVSFFEAEAYCRWAGRRLPSEAEWEIAASRVPTANGEALEPGKRRYPWGNTATVAPPANLDAYRLGCVDVAAFPEGESAFGCRQMLGNVWEWTGTIFGPFPGFKAELYAEYSEPWFAEKRRVLRGGAWATRSRLVHNGYRNFFTPERNDIIAGFRTVALDS